MVDHGSKSSISSTRWYQCNRNYTQELMAHTPKQFQFILKKVKKPPDGFCTRLFFALEIIVISSGFFLHRLSRILKIKLNWLSVPKTDFARQKFRTRRYNPTSSKPGWKASKKPPRGHTKIDPFFWIFSKDRICHILSSRVES